MPSAGSAEFRHPVSMNVICHPPVPRVSQIIMHGVHIHIFLCYKFPSGASQTFVPSNVTVSPLPIKPGSVPCMISGIYRLTNQSRIPAQHKISRHVSPAHSITVHNRIIDGPVLQCLVIGNIIIDPIIKYSAFSRSPNVLHFCTTSESLS